MAIVSNFPIDSVWHVYDEAIKYGFIGTKANFYQALSLLATTQPKDPYQLAKAGGYHGTEEEFKKILGMAPYSPLKIGKYGYPNNNTSCMADLSSPGNIKEPGWYNLCSMSNYSNTFILYINKNFNQTTTFSAVVSVSMGSNYEYKEFLHSFNILQCVGNITSGIDKIRIRSDSALSSKNMPVFFLDIHYAAAVPNAVNVSLVGTIKSDFHISDWEPVDDLPDGHHIDLEQSFSAVSIGPVLTPNSTVATRPAILQAKGSDSANTLLENTYQNMPNDSIYTVFLNQNVPGGPIFGGLWTVFISKANSNYGFMRASRYGTDKDLNNIIYIRERSLVSAIWSDWNLIQP